MPVMQLQAHHQHAEQWNSHHHAIWLWPDMSANWQISSQSRFRPKLKNLNPVHPQFEIII